MAFSFHALTPDRLPEWDAFVAANPHAWPGQDSAIVRFEELRGFRSLCHLATDADGRLAAAIPLFLAEGHRARGLVGWRVLQSGSSLRGGPLLGTGLNAGARRAFWGEWRDWAVALARREGADAIRLSLPNFFGAAPVRDVEPRFPLEDFGFRASAAQTLVLDLAAAAPGGPLRSIYGKSCRASLRQAERAGATVEPVTDRAAWLACHEMAEQTFRGEDEAPPSRELMAWIWDGFVARGLAEACGVRYRGALIGVAATVGTRHSRYYWFGFNRKPRPVPGANNLLLDAILERERGRGTRWMELGSLETEDPRQRGIAAFKRSFGGAPRPAMGGELTLSRLKRAGIDALGALASLGRRRPTD